MFDRKMFYSHRLSKKKKKRTLDLVQHHQHEEDCGSLVEKNATSLLYFPFSVQVDKKKHPLFFSQMEPTEPSFPNPNPS